MENVKNALAQAIFGRSRKDGECVKCGRAVRPEDFKDEVSRKEYTITFWCQTCQDDFFGKEE